MIEHYRVIVDTNLVVSALLFGGVPRALLDLIVANKIPILVSNDTLQELHDTLHKLKFTDRFAALAKTPQHLYDQFVAITERIETNHIENAKVRDPKDVIILECAVSGFATHIITGDKDLLTLKAYEDVAIVTPSRFLSLLNNDPSTPETTSTSDE